MTTRNYSSRSQQTTLTSAVTAGASSMVVVSGTALLGGQSIPGGTTFTIVLDPDTAIEEIVDATAVSTNTFTITRAIDGSTAQAHSAGAVVRHMAIGRDYRESNQHIEATTAVHGLGVSSAVVGTTDTQTLTNKTLTAPTITNPNISGAGVDASIVFEGATPDAFETTLTVVDPTQDNTVTIPNTTGTVVIASAVQTLTNKTLTSPTISGSPVITGLSSAGMSASSATPKDYVDSILGSATSAATSAASAATSAASAATSAASSETSAIASASSATASATSATAAATSATSAAASATAAATSATSAAASATAAATSATSANASAITAAASVATISGFATTASNSASAAATSATSASASATAAATSASSASTSASAAATSASSASTSASSALTSANSAATSAASAAAAVAASFDAKGDLLVGTGADAFSPLTVATTNGYVLAVNSATGTGLEWQAAPAGYLAPTIGTTTITSGTTVSTITGVTLSNATVSGTLTAAASTGTNGQYLQSTGSGTQWATVDSLPSQTGNAGEFLTTDGTSASWAVVAGSLAQPTEPTSPTDGQIWVDTDGSVVGQAVTRWSKVMSAGVTAISGLDDSSVTLTYTSGYEQVYRNGTLLSRSNDYTATNGTSITLIDATLANDVIEVIGSAVLGIADVYTQTQSNAAFVPQTTNFFAGKNKIINGDFSINQRNFVSETATQYCFDRWSFAQAGATLTCSAQTFTLGTAPVAGYEGKNFVRLAVTTGSDFARMSQLIESVRTFANQTITVSFYAKGTNPTTDGNLKVYLQQNFGTGGSPSATVTVTEQTFVLTANWVRYSFQFTVPSIAGKTLGTANNDYLAVIIGQGSSVSADAWTLDLWGVQAEAGSIATPFQTATGTIQGELAACKRYYQKSYAAAVAPATATQEGAIFYKTAFTNSYQQFYTTFGVEMRVTPTITFYSTSNGASGQAYNGTTNVAVTAAGQIGTTSMAPFINNVSQAADIVLRTQYQAEAEL